MNLEERLMLYKKETQLESKEKNIQETIRISKEVFFASEQERMLSHREFLWSQFQLIQKRWWMLQFLILLVLGAVLVSSYEESYEARGMGVAASAFIILMIPELWKNRSCHCMEIEEASYYSLRQIYAARMVLFGIVDVFLLTVFCGAVTIGQHIEFTRLIVQFLMPMLVTACICFGTLCSRFIMDETIAIILCVLWCVVWLAVTLNEKIYKVITLPVWMAFIVLASCFLCAAVYRTLSNCENYWEAGWNEIRTE